MMGNQYGTGVRMAQSSHGPLPPPNNYNKCSSNNATSVPLEDVDSGMEGAVMPAVATAAEDTANTMERIKQEEGGISSSS